uniref:Uncharacterized protein n=1 Tax=Oryza punctata TaxID=4537 RepID=A0A0E0MN49_ORYPU
MEATVLSVGKSVLNGALDYAKSAVAEEVALQLGIQRDQAFIRDELEMMHSFLMTAHDEREDNKVIRTWVKQVRDVAYDVEDCLQDFAVRLGRKKPCWWHSPRTLRERHRIAKRIKELKGKVEDVSQRNMRYQLIRSSAGSNPSSDNIVVRSKTARTTMSGNYEALQQQEKAKANLVRLVNSKVEERRVLAVWTESGRDTGETSVIGRTYDYLKRKNKFECCAWINLMHPPKLEELLQTIIRQFYLRYLQEAGEATPGYQVLRKMSMMKEDCLVDEFKKYLDHKCYLIVLNDLSTIQQWEQIKPCFPDNKKGSRIIVSTQQIEVASLCVGSEVAPEHMQLFADQTLYAFHCKGVEQGTASMEPLSSINTATSYGNNSVEQESLTRTETIAAAFKESEIIGRVDEKANIIELISKDSQQLKKISVWGMGGVGKTTLVQDIYRSEKVKGIFDKLACVTIIRPFSPKELLRSLVKQLEDPRASERNETPKASERKEPSLASILGGSKYLIVLDDVSSTTEWDDIQSHFPTTETGGRIIFTTRYESVAKHCSGDEGERYKLGNLGDKDAKDLFMKKVFKDSVNLDGLDPELVEEADLILRKCNGLPLAIITIGGFLASRPKTYLEWRKLNEHISAELEMNPELENIKTVLDKSYDGLPYDLKSCFLYLSIFPEGHKISRRRLVRRWIAEGYSKELCDKSGEEIGNGYFFELVERSMIVPTQSLIRSSKGVDSCQVHDLMRDIAISKSREENLVLRLDGVHRLHSQGTARHLAIRNRNSEWDEGELESTVDMSRIRSLTVFGEWRHFFISDKMKLLRVLDLEDTEGVGDHQIKQIGKLVHLKYLSLIGCNITCLPNSLGNLRQLETLDIRGTYIVMLPKTIINLQKLNYLRAGDRKVHGYEEIAEQSLRSRLCSAIGVSDWDDEGNTRMVCTLCCCCPPHISAVCLDRHGVLAPRGLRRLTTLHTLDIVNIAKEKTVLEDIKRLTQLRKLGVSGVNKKNSQKFCSALAALNSLESLSVISVGQLGLSDCLDWDDKFSPPKALKAIRLHGNLSKLPEWIQQLKNLVKLRLSNTRLEDHNAVIRVLGELPNLAILCLWNRPFQGGEIHFQEGSFRSLIVLELDFSGFKFVTFEQGAFHKLELLLLSVFYQEIEAKLSRLEFLPSIREVQLDVLIGGYKEKMPVDVDKQRFLEEAKERLKMDLLDQLSRNIKKPILKVT